MIERSATQFTHKLSIVVPTLGRPQELSRMLNSLAIQTFRPQEIIIVEQGERKVDKIAEYFPYLDIRYMHMQTPSATKARNIGMKRVSPDITLIGFLDDDIVLDSKAIEAMLIFWEDAPDEIGGAGFNLINPPSLELAWLKHLPIITKIGLYSQVGGRVTRSGFHTRINYVTETTYVEWLPGWVIYRRDVLDKFKFDEWFEGYSYLEDLDLSYRISKKYKLVVVADACFYHYPSSTGRLNGYLFGKREVINRLYFLRKHPELSFPLCCLAIFLRSLLSLFHGIAKHDISYLKRFGGNWSALLSDIRGNKASNNKECKSDRDSGRYETLL